MHACNLHGNKIETQDHVGHERIEHLEIIKPFKAACRSSAKTEDEALEKIFNKIKAK